MISSITWIILSLDIFVSLKTSANSKKWLLFFLTNVKRNNEILYSDVIFTNQIWYFICLKSLIISLIWMMTKNNLWSFFDLKLFTIQFSTTIAKNERIETLSIFWQIYNTSQKFQNFIVLFTYFNIDRNDKEKILARFVSSWSRFNTLDHFLISFYWKYKVFMSFLHHYHNIV